MLPFAPLSGSSLAPARVRANIKPPVLGRCVLYFVNIKLFARGRANIKLFARGIANIKVLISGRYLVPARGRANIKSPVKDSYVLI